MPCQTFDGLVSRLSKQAHYNAAILLKQLMPVGPKWERAPSPRLKS